jgi:exodeoxyribonuclease VII small subunit
VSFEGALEQLEHAVARLEEGDMPLEEALELFESGIKLSRQCNTTLEAAERRIEILMADQGVSKEDWRAEPFDPELEDVGAGDSMDGDSDEEDFED